MCNTKTAKCLFVLTLWAQSICYSIGLELSETIFRRLNQAQPRCKEQVAICQANSGSSKLPLSEWNDILSRLSGVATFDEVKSTIANLTEIDFSDVTLLDDIDSSTAAEIITDFEASMSALKGSSILEEAEITANQIGVVGEFLNVLNVVFDFVQKTTGLDLRFLTTVIGNIIAAQALGIGPILSAVISGMASLTIAIIERLAWLVVGIAGKGGAGGGECFAQNLIDPRQSNWPIQQCNGDGVVIITVNGGCPPPGKKTGESNFCLFNDDKNNIKDKTISFKGTCTPGTPSTFQFDMTALQAAAGLPLNPTACPNDDAFVAAITAQYYPDNIVPTSFSVCQEGFACQTVRRRNLLADDALKGEDSFAVHLRTSKSSCYSELMKCETLSMISILVPGMLSGAFAAMKDNAEEGSP